MASINGVAKGVADGVNAFRGALTSGPHAWSEEIVEKMSLEFHRQLTQAALNDKTINFNR